MVILHVPMGNVGAGGNAGLCSGVHEWVCGARQASNPQTALKVSPETRFQNLVVEKTPGVNLTLCLPGCIPEMISQVFKHRKKIHQVLAAHVKTHVLQGTVQPFHSDKKCPPGPGPGRP